MQLRRLDDDVLIANCRVDRITVKPFDFCELPSYFSICVVIRRLDVRRFGASEDEVGAQGFDWPKVGETAGCHARVLKNGAYR